MPTPTDHSEAVSFPASAHHHDITLTFTQRLALRRLLDRRPLLHCDLDVVIGPLVGAGLVEHDGTYWTLTDDGRAYLAAHDEAKTRRTERPARPAVPERWSYSYEVEAWVYEGRLTDCVLEDPGPDDLEADIERVEAELALLRYLRADRAHQSREARDGAPVAPSAARSGGTDGVGAGRPGEPPCLHCEGSGWSEEEEDDTDDDTDDDEGGTCGDFGDSACGSEIPCPHCPAGEAAGREFDELMAAPWEVSP